MTYHQKQSVIWGWRKSFIQPYPEIWDILRPRDYLTLRLRLSEHRLVITESEATNCFSINFQVFTNNNQHNFIKFTSNLLVYKKDKKQKAIVTDQWLSLQRQ